VTAPPARGARFRPQLHRGARVLGGLLVVALAGAACLPSSTVEPASPTPTAAPATPAATASTPAVASTRPSPAPIPDGLVLVDIPSAGVRLPVPAAWEQVGEAALADEAVRADVVARYPGMASFLEAAGQLGDRATPALLVLDPGAQHTDTAIAPGVAVLVAQPAVSGPLLDFVAGFIADGLAETFGAPAPVQERVATPIGEAIRMTFELPPDGTTPLAATAWVVGAEQATLVVVVVGPGNAGPAADPDALIDAAQPLPAP
jgi:hypothetical protein